MDSVIKDRINKIEEGIVPEGYKKTKIGIIPEDWEVKSLGDIRDFNDRHSFAGGPFGSNLKVKDYRSEGIRIIQLQNIGDGYFDNRNQVYTSVEKADELISSNIYPGEIIIAKMAEPLARACIIPEYEERYLMASDGIRLKLNKDNDALYMKEIINGSRFRNRAYQLGTGTTRKRISLTELRKILVPNPTLQEQEKIADILSTWDKAIENIEKLIKEKEIQKKGLMQELLTGETRLPGFSGEWGEITLGEVGRFFNGRNLAKKDIEDKGSYNCILYGELFTLYSEIICNIENKTNNMEENSVIGMSNDLLFPTSTTVDALSLITPSSLKVDNVILGGDIMVYRADKNIIDSSYLSYYFNSSGKMQLARFAQGITIIHIYSSDVKDLKINLPPLPEQKAIAEILSTADKEIELLKQLLEYKKEEKKGLMQLLLTGIVRV